MRRFTWHAAILLVLIAGIAAVAFGQEGITHWRGNDYPWDKIPAVAPVGAEGDTRIRLVEEAVEFWNQQLQGIGTPFRLGPVTHRAEAEVLPAHGSGEGLPLEALPAGLATHALTRVQVAGRHEREPCLG